MTTLTTTSQTGPFVLVGSENGITVIPTQTPLARLNYFDGKFLRAADLNAEQRYLRSLVELSNRAGGHGIAHGFDVVQKGVGQLEISPGLAIDPEGRVLLLPAATSIGLSDLIEKTRQSLSLASTTAGLGAAAFGDCVTVTATPPTQVVGGGDLYVITIAHAEALCGEEDVYGKLCEEACITSTDRPFRIEGIVLRARPLLLSVPLPTSGIGLTLTHWRSQVASAYFEEERRRVGSLISKAGLESDVWCHGAVPDSGNELPIAVVGRVGQGIHFLDLWTVRRERIDTPARRYWQWRMAMRPWDVFLAHVLQFQCQLNAALGQGPAGDNPDDPCREAQSLVEEANAHFQTLKTFYAETTQRLMKMSKSVRERALGETTLSQASLNRLDDFGTRLSKATAAFKALPTDRILIHGGIIELPSAGYLPVVPGSTLTVNEQVKRLLGDGVDLRFCLVRPDYVAHALEEAQHLERISLTAGLDNPAQKQEVDILVPYGQVAPDRVDLGRFYEMRLNVNFANLAILAAAFAVVRDLGSAADTGKDATTSASTQLALLKRYLELIDREAKGALVLEYPTGAARSEAAPDGALSFCYAGTTGAFQWNGVFGETPSTSPPPAPAPAPGAASVAAGGVSSASGMFTIREVRSVARGQVEGRSSLWVAFDIGADPGEMAAGESAPVRAEVYLLLTLATKGADTKKPTTDEALLHLSFLGDLQVEDADVRSGKAAVREIKAVLSGQLTFSTLTTGEEREAGSVHLSESLTMVRTEGTFGPAYKIELPNPTILDPLVAELEVRREWQSATQAESIGMIGFRALKQREEDAANLRTLNSNKTAFGHGLAARYGAIRDALRQVFANVKVVNRQAYRAWQTIKPEVLDPTHPAHESAIRAVRGIGTALGSAKFADLAAKRLFPAPSPAASGLNILATLDWVLFHRRREKRCQVEKPMPQVQTRAYALYQAQLPGDLQVADLAKALARGGSDLGPFELNFVQVVEYGAGIHSVVSPHSQLLASWRQDVGTDAGRIEGGVIASRGLAAAEGERLAEDRLEAVVEVVAPVTPPVIHPSYFVQNRVPDGFVVAGNDGMVVVATRPVATAVCHEVLTFAGRAEAEFARFRALVESDGLQAALEKFAEILSRTTVNFDRAGGTLDAAGRELVAKLFDPAGAPRQAVTYVAAAGDAADGKTEAMGILSVVGGTTIPLDVLVASDFARASDCHGMTIVLVEGVTTQCHEVRVAINPDGAIGMIQESAGSPAFAEVLAKYSQPVGSPMRFAPGTTTPSGTTLDDVVAAWAALGTSQPPTFAVLFFKDADPGQPVYEGQRDVLLERLNVPERTSQPVRGAYPEGCPAITVLVPPPPASTEGRLARVVFVARDTQGNALESRTAASGSLLRFDASNRLGTDLQGTDVETGFKPQMRGGEARVTLVASDPGSEDAKRRLEAVVKKLDSVGIRVVEKSIEKPDDQDNRVLGFITRGGPLANELVVVSYEEQP